jgi:hypothetical protein
MYKVVAGNLIQYYRDQYSLYQLEEVDDMAKMSGFLNKFNHLRNNETVQ